jgi:hypothetical protein
MRHLLTSVSIRLRGLDILVVVLEECIGLRTRAEYYAFSRRCEGLSRLCGGVGKKSESGVGGMSSCRG